MRKYSAESAALLDNVTKARNRTAHGKTSIGKERVWSMLKDCERFVKQSYEESRRVS
jgi:hypothetical protein